MYYSQYTFHTPESDNPRKLILGNYLSGSIDIVEEDEVEEFLRHVETGNWENYKNLDHLLERGYLFKDESEESMLIGEKHYRFLSEYEKTATQLIFVPTYICNFSCEYCYQVDYQNPKAVLRNDITDKFFSYIDSRFSKEPVKPYITLFGGEPLLGGNEYKKSILYFLENARDKGYGVAIVTNGYELADYIPDFLTRKLNIKEIQVTLDGVQEIHDKRRPVKNSQDNSKGTFEKITEGIELALKSGYPINLRAIVDKINMPHLPALAEFTNQKGWLNYPAGQFQTTLGRNYELHFCQTGTPLYERAEMWSDYVSLAKQHPVLYKYHKPQFHGMRGLYENGELPVPIFDGCPAGKKEWAFDFKGDIYGCTASVGVEKYKLGSFITGDIVNEEQILEWKKRDVFSIPECKTCAVSLSCGGGCGVLAANNSGGKILSPDCRPVKELVALGIDYYNLENTQPLNKEVCCN
jgi:uncharacterized protein